MLPGLFGQADRARISGIVTDETQALIPGVDVTALNIKTGVRTSVNTNEGGNYSLVNLPIGTYTIGNCRIKYICIFHRDLTLIYT